MSSRLGSYFDYLCIVSCIWLIVHSILYCERCDWVSATFHSFDLVMLLWILCSDLWYPKVLICINVSYKIYSFLFKHCILFFFFCRKFFLWKLLKVHLLIIYLSIYPIGQLSIVFLSKIVRLYWSFGLRWLNILTLLRSIKKLVQYAMSYYHTISVALDKEAQNVFLITFLFLFFLCLLFIFSHGFFFLSISLFCLFLSS